jgi:hypothetical protein
MEVLNPPKYFNFFFVLNYVFRQSYMASSLFDRKAGLPALSFSFPKTNFLKYEVNAMLKCLTAGKHPHVRVFLNTFYSIACQAEVTE